nr:uncharacterized protein LOC113399719 [Vanessa tameamea]XP_026494699.1 uncharacterized protein LOC113399719 [Vanessa tameamea]
MLKMFKILYIVLVSAALVYGKTSFVSIPPELLSNMFRRSTECVEKTGIDAESLQKILVWKLEDTESTRNYIYCFAKSIGYADGDGYLVKDRIMELAGNHRSKNELGKVIDECNGSKGSSKDEIMYKTAVCFLQKSPILFTL